MSKITFDDKRGSRGLRHLNLLAARLPNGQQVVFEFTGKQIPGICQVIKEDYSKNGKFSANYWDCELAEGVIGWSHSQRWETGAWLDSKRWPEAIAEFSNHYGENRGIDPDAAERFIRATWKQLARAMDKASQEAKSDPSVALQELLEAQEELAEANREFGNVVKEIATLEETERCRQEAVAIRERTAKAREAMKKGVSLSELRSLLG